MPKIWLFVKWPSGCFGKERKLKICRELRDGNVINKNDMQWKQPVVDVHVCCRCQLPVSLITYISVSSVVLITDAWVMLNTFLSNKGWNKLFILLSLSVICLRNSTQGLSFFSSSLFDSLAESHQLLVSVFKVLLSCFSRLTHLKSWPLVVSFFYGSLCHHLCRFPLAFMSLRKMSFSFQ